MNRSPLRSKRKSPRRSERVRDPEHLSAVHRVGCWAAASIRGHVCGGPIEADHVGRRPLGRKCDDSQTMAICSKGHMERHAFSGPHKTWDKDLMRRWLDAGMAWTQAQVLLLGAG